MDDVLITKKFIEATPEAVFAAAAGLGWVVAVKSMLCSSSRGGS